MNDISTARKFNVDEFNREVSTIQNRFLERRVKVSLNHVKKLARMMVEGAERGGTMVRLPLSGGRQILMWKDLAYRLMVEALRDRRSLSRQVDHEIEWESCDVSWFDRSLDEFIARVSRVRPNLFGLTTDRRRAIADKLKVLEQRVRPI